MPILRVDVVGPVPNEVRAGLARRISDAAAPILASRPQGTWTLINFVPQANYAENEAFADQSPVLVSLLLAHPPSGTALSTTLSQLTSVIARACERAAENVHVIVEPPGAERVSFGGNLQT